MSLLLGIFLIQALPTAPDVSHAVAIDPEHTLVLIGGRKMNYPAMGEYGMSLYILRDDRFTRFRFEPNLNGEFEPVRN